MLVNRNATDIELPQWQVDLLEKSIAENTECPFERDNPVGINEPCPVCRFKGNFIDPAFCIDDYR